MLGKKKHRQLPVKGNTTDKPKQCFLITHSKNKISGDSKSPKEFTSHQISLLECLNRMKGLSSCFERSNEMRDCHEELGEL